MTQPKRKKKEGDELVKVIHETMPGELVKVLEYGIQGFIDAELSDRLGVEPYERSKDRDNYRKEYQSHRTSQPGTASEGKMHSHFSGMRRAAQG